MRLHTYDLSPADLKKFIARYQERVFAFVTHLLGGGQDAVYEVCAGSFARAMSATPFLEREDVFLKYVLRTAINMSRRTQTIPTLDVLDLLEASDQEKESLRIVLKALQTLDFSARASILLRDQLNLSDSQIAAILQISVKEARRRILQARLQLREKVQSILENITPERT